jgi:hypothetical protein
MRRFEPNRAQADVPDEASAAIMRCGPHGRLCLGTRHFMLPPILAIVAIEMIRDGGSLQAAFLGANGSKYCLHFKLISKRGASGELMRLGYERAVLFERLELRQDNRFVWRSINEVEVSWEHATVILHQLHNLLRHDRDSKWLEAMEEVASSEGQLPRDISQVLESVGPHLRD